MLEPQPQSIDHNARDQNARPVDQNRRPGPPGARWFIACVYVFVAVVYVAWLSGWDEKSFTTASAPAPQHHTIMGSAASR